MALNWTRHDLPTREQKEAWAKEQAEKDRLPDRVAEDYKRITGEDYVVA